MQKTQAKAGLVQMVGLQESCAETCTKGRQFAIAAQVSTQAHTRIETDRDKQKFMFLQLLFTIPGTRDCTRALWQQQIG